jgi:hypothetical protein
MENGSFMTLDALAKTLSSTNVDDATDPFPTNLTSNLPTTSVHTGIKKQEYKLGSYQSTLLID